MLVGCAAVYAQSEESRKKEAEKRKASEFPAFYKALSTAATTKDLLACFEMRLADETPVEAVIELAKNRREGLKDLWTPDVSQAFGALLRRLRKESDSMHPAV